MHWIQICTTVCLPRKPAFIIIVVSGAFLCFLSIRHFQLYNVLSISGATNEREHSGQSSNVTGLYFDGFQNDIDLPVEVASPAFKSLDGWSKATWNMYQIKQSASRLRNCVTREEILMKFQRCYQASEAKDPQCKAVHANPDSYWKSQPKSFTTLTHDEDFKRMDLASKCCAFNYSALVLNSPRDPPFPWEQDYLCSTGPLMKLEDTAYASLSSVHLKRDAMRSFSVGDKVTVEVVVKNGHGEVQKLGGDSVRVWLVSPDLGASITADVTDLRNGSYRATSTLPWAGKVSVKATIAHTRNLFRTIAYIQRYFSTSHWFTALWKKGVYSEATPCSPYPALPAFAVNEICNMTNKNEGFPWYCGRPSKEQLSCSDYVSARKIDYPSYQPITAAEEDLILLTESKRPFLIPSNIILEVKPKPVTTESTVPLPTLPCNQRDLTQTFAETNQLGYMYGHSWRPFACSLPNVTSSFLQECLKNTQILYLGDSNTRLQMDIVTPLINCRNKIVRERGNWHAPLWCHNDALNISVKYFPPMHPFYGSVGEHVKPEVLSSAVSKMDAIPATGKYIVHLHQFLHFMPFHLGLVEHRMRIIRTAVERLLARNRHVIVVYQSAFSSYDHSPKNKHKLNAWLAELQRTTMTGLGPRVMFVNTLPITIGIENKSGHPKESDHFMRIYMGHICGRTLT